MTDVEWADRLWQLVKLNKVGELSDAEIENERDLRLFISWLSLNRNRPSATVAIPPHFLRRLTVVR